MSYKGWNTELTFVPSFQINLRKCSAGKYVWHCFEKSIRSWLDCKQNEWWSRSSRSTRFYEKVVLKISQRFTRKYLCQSLILDIFRRSSSEASFKTRLQHKFFCELCEICYNRFFAKRHRPNTSDYSSINISEERIEWNCNLWYRN